MSKAEQTVNVEDVLSSIRRLVADGPRIIPEHPKPTFASEPEPTETTDTIVEPEMSEPTLEDIAQPASFVDTMNASIAEITEHSDEASVNDAPISDVEARVAHVDAFLASETAPDIENDTDKSEPFVLRPEMVAGSDFSNPETDTSVEPEEIQLNTSETDEDDDISFHDTLEDDEAYLNSIEEDDGIETEISDEEAAVEAPLFDEETIREIVSEMVRAELQGDLGDRITRNVRKLVRREIHHALATRDFE